MLKLFFDDKPLSSDHAIRGIGSYTRNLLEEFKNRQQLNIVSGLQEAEVVHYPYFDLFFNTLRLSNKPTVVTIFHTIPFISP